MPFEASSAYSRSADAAKPTITRSLGSVRQTVP